MRSYADEQPPPAREQAAERQRRTQASQRHFDRWSRAYSGSRSLALLQRKALAELELRADDHVLDVACGSGKLVRAVAPRVRRAVGVDLSPGMLDEAQKQSAQEGFAIGDEVEFHRAPSDRLPFEDGEFTVVVTTTAFHHFPDPEASVREMMRALAPGGRIVIADFCRDTPPTMLADVALKRFEDGHVGIQRKREIERMLGGVGVRVIRSRFVWLGLYAFVAGVKDASRSARDRGP